MGGIIDLDDRKPIAIGQSPHWRCKQIECELNAAITALQQENAQARETIQNLSSRLCANHAATMAGDRMTRNDGKCEVCVLQETIERLSAPVTDQECHRFRAHHGDSNQSLYWIARALSLFIASRAGKE